MNKENNEVNNTANKKSKRADKLKVYLNKQPNHYLMIFIGSVLLASIVCFLLFNKSNTTVDVIASTEVIVEPTIEQESVIVEPTVEETSIETTTETTTEITTQAVLSIEKSYNTSVKSNLTEEEIEYILDGTYLEGTAWAFKEIEDTYGVNAIFALSVAETETTFGRYGVAQSHNNAFGLTSTSGGFMYFDNLADSVLYFGAYIPRVHWKNGRYYIGDIAPAYCDYEWGDKVESSLEHWYEIAYNLR